MIWYLLRRGLQTLVTVAIVLTVVFFLSYLSGDPVAAMFPDLTPAQLEAMRHQLGYDRPVVVQFGEYVLGVLQGDLGTSSTFRQPVATIVSRHIWPTLQLVWVSSLVAAVIGVVTGLIAAINAGRAIDRANTFTMSLLQSTPPFWSALMLILLVAVHLRLLPSSGSATPAHIVLPALTLALFSCGVFSRVTRASVLERLGELHLVAARSRGVSGLPLYGRHVVANAMPPIIASVGYRAAELAGGAVVIENIFGWPGIGTVLLNAVFRRDYLLIQGCVLTISVVVIVTNLVVDLVVPLIDRRVSLHA